MVGAPSMRRLACLAAAASLVATSCSDAAHADPAGRGLQIGVNIGLDAGPYRGDGVGWGYGIDLGWNLDRRRALFVVFDIGSSDRGDADPISRLALEGRLRWFLGGDAAHGTTGGAIVPYVGLGVGAGVVANPLAHLDGALVTLPLEVGLELRAGAQWTLVLALRERAGLTIGTGDPAFSFLNRIGPAVSLRF